MNACAYRSVEPVLVERLDALRQRRAADRAGIAAAERIAARRVGWAAAGMVGVAFAGAAFLVALATDLPGTGVPSAEGAWATGLLLGGWIAAAVAGIVTARVVRAWRATELAVEQTLSGDVAADLARVDACDPLRDARALAGRWERASTALPLAAMSLLAPLTVHWIVYSFVLDGVGRGLSGDLADFSQWIAISAVLVGHAHLALLLASVCWAWKLRSRETPLVAVDVHRTWAIALGAAVGAACFPGLALIAVPPVLVFATGLVFVPAMFLATARRLVRERTLLEANA